MDDGGPLGVLGGAHGGQHGGDAGTDVLAHDDGHGSGVADGAGGRQGLEDTDGGGGGLDHRGQDSTGDDAQDGIGEQQEQVRKPGFVPEALDRAGHGIHAEHQRGEAQQDHADVLLPAVLDEHVVDDADEGQHRGEGGGLQQLHDQVVALNAA